jgi:soluble lytic murein transglycosylase
VRNLRQAGRRAEALSLLTQIDSRGLPEPGQDLIWTERRNLLNEAIVTRDWQSAYRIASTHGYQRGERFADGEFISGWVSLRFLNQPTVALEHFKRLESGVRTPVSRARAAYWLGRTADVLNQPDIAESHYRAAAAFPTVYYGQLAAVKLAETLGQVAQLTLPPEKKATQEDRDRLNARSMMAIINLLSDAGENQFFRDVQGQLRHGVSFPKIARRSSGLLTKKAWSHRFQTTWVKRQEPPGKSSNPYLPLLNPVIEAETGRPIKSV